MKWQLHNQISVINSTSPEKESILDGLLKNRTAILHLNNLTVWGHKATKADFSYVLKKRFLMGIYDSMLVKYGAVMIGYTVVGLPVFGPNSEEYLAKFGNDQA